MNIYAGVPNNIKGRVRVAAQKALVREVQEAIRKLRDGANGRFNATIEILESLIGEAEDQ